MIHGRQILQLVKITCICYIYLFTGLSFGQTSLTKKEHDKALLQVSSGFYTVEKSATVDLDSSLLITSRWHKLIRVGVITEDIDDAYTGNNCRWIDKNNADSVRKKLS